MLWGLCCNFIYLHFGCEKWKETGDVYICVLNTIVLIQLFFFFVYDLAWPLLVIGYMNFFYIRNSSGFYFEIGIFYDILFFHDGVLQFRAYYVRNIMFEVGSVPGDALIYHFS